MFVQSHTEISRFTLTLQVILLWICSVLILVNRTWVEVRSLQVAGMCNSKLFLLLCRNLEIVMIWCSNPWDRCEDVESQEWELPQGDDKSPQIWRRVQERCCKWADQKVKTGKCTGKKDETMCWWEKKKEVKQSYIVDGFEPMHLLYEAAESAKDTEV